MLDPPKPQAAHDRSIEGMQLSNSGIHDQQDESKELDSLLARLKRAICRALCQPARTQGEHPEHDSIHVRVEVLHPIDHK